MALIKCKDCNQEISSEAKICPKCGAALNRIGFVKGTAIFLCISILIAIAGGAVYHVMDTRRQEKETAAVIKKITDDTNKFIDQSRKRSGIR